MGKRMIAVFSACCILFTGLYLRIGSISSDAFYTEAGTKQSSYTLSLPKARGTIYDSSFQPLVNQYYDYIAAVLPTDQNFKILSEHTVDLTKSELEELYESGKPFLCKVDTYEPIDEHIEIFPVAIRYGEKVIAPHVIGYLNSEGTEGIAGIEKAYQNLFTNDATATTITYTLDGMGKSMEEIEPVITYGMPPSGSIVLTLDKEIQKICEKAGNREIKKGAIVVMECATGKIRAMCSFPEYSLDTLVQDLADEEHAPMINRALTPMSVGSTFKIVTATAALNQGYDLTSEYVCTGVYQLGDQNFHCHLREGHGTLDLKNALMVSCNPFFIDLGLQLDPKEILKAANDLSFGKQYELAPGIFAQSGELPTAEELQEPGQVANLSFGQGRLTATPVQLAQMISSVANGGFTPTPILVEGITRDGKTLESEAEISGIQAMSEQQVSVLREYLTACVMEREGQKATPSTVSAGGKTATAQTGIYRDGVELSNGGFVGFFPAEEPKYAVAVMVEDAETGNENASPVFKEIAEAISILER